MSQLKNRLQALSLLDRAFTAVTDSELEALIASLPDDHRSAIDEICEAPEGGFTDPTGEQGRGLQHRRADFQNAGPAKLITGGGFDPLPEGRLRGEQIHHPPEALQFFSHQNERVCCCENPVCPLGLGSRQG